MRIAVKVIVEMTPEQVDAYCANECVARGELRDDVKNYVRTILQDASSFTGGAADVIVKAAS